jgi:hypothetical protein
MEDKEPAITWAALDPVNKKPIKWLSINVERRIDVVDEPCLYELISDPELERFPQNGRECKHYEIASVYGAHGVEVLEEGDCLYEFDRENCFYRFLGRVVSFNKEDK